MGQMEDRKWEDLEMDCLVNIFGRLGLEDKILGVPFVCHSWYKASTNPLCWKVLNFESLDLGRLSWKPSPFVKRFKREYHVENFSFTGFLKFVVNRSRRCCVQLILPEELTEEDMIYVSDECPAVKLLSFHQYAAVGYKLQPELLRKWTNLEILCVDGLLQPAIIEILSEINNHCKNFYGLKACVRFDDKIASAFATYLPKIKCLNLGHSALFMSSTLSKENLMVILEGCKDLELLYLKNCVGFDVDEEILKSASHIKDFNCEGAQLHSPLDQVRFNFEEYELDEDFFDEVYAELNQAFTDDS
ncbi:F-box/LRR-repeat protein At3g48880-like [Tasmannia lanceolata]|uniref:F-box/LRR-repeat protein At3g48880-like n=1 Tax=Tasmannia lanceolata TaxID=3420 RepID=UPI0040628D8F